MTRITVVGCGYLGAVHAAQGQEVLGVEPDAERVALLQPGRAPFYEPDIADLLATGRPRSGLEFTVDVKRASDRQVHFLCVGTPQRTDGYECRTLDPVALSCPVDRKVRVDGRRALDAEKWEAAGWLYRT